MSAVFAKGLGVGTVATGAIGWGLYEFMKPGPYDGLTPPQKDIVSVGMPTPEGTCLYSTRHVLKFNHNKKTPLWVQEHLTKDNLKGEVHRNIAHFRSDERIDEIWRSHSKDYTKSGWSKGHMAPAANHKSSEKDMSDTFLLSNVVPQDVHNNANYWARLEFHCRALTALRKNVWVTSGPAYLPFTRPSDKENKFMTYRVIGDNDVAVPTHLYKVILTEADDGTKAVGAFVVPNTKVKNSNELKHYQVSLASLEKTLGFKFYPNVKRAGLKDLCETGGCDMISHGDFQNFVYGKQIAKANSIEKIEKIWDTLKQEKGDAISETLKEAYKERKSFLEANKDLSKKDVAAE